MLEVYSAGPLRRRVYLVRITPSAILVCSGPWMFSILNPLSCTSSPVSPIFALKSGMLCFACSLLSYSCSTVSQSPSSSAFSAFVITVSISVGVISFIGGGVVVGGVVVVGAGVVVGSVVVWGGVVV